MIREGLGFLLGVITMLHCCMLSLDILMQTRMTTILLSAIVNIFSAILLLLVALYPSNNVFIVSTIFIPLSILYQKNKPKNEN